MKVTMQYTIDLNEVPLRLNDMMQDCTTHLETITKLATVIDALNPDKFITHIDFIRKKLFEVDTQLSECGELMQGYKNALNPDEVTPPAEGTAQYPSMPNVDLEALQGLQKQLEGMQKEAEETTDDSQGG